MSNEQLQLFDPDKIVKKRYPTVSTAEKRRLLEEAGEPWPVCDCCGIEKIWHSDSRQKSGGSWKLRCTHLESLRRLRKTPGTYTYNEVHGIGKPGEVKKAKERKYFGVFWRLKPGFQVNLLYKCVDAECLDEKQDIWKFYLKKNRNKDMNLIYS